jgi:hypothetical protein
LSRLNRRTFMQLSSGAVTSGALVLAASRKVMAQAAATKVTSKDGKIRVEAAAYAWEYAQADDSFRLLDDKGRVIVSGRMQPSIVVAPSGDPSRRLCTQGKALAPRVEDGKVLLIYEGVNGAARVFLNWRFDDYGAWLEPIEYDSAAEEDVVSVHYFTYADGLKHSPSLSASYLVVPGISEGDAVSPILYQTTQLNESVWLGRGSFTPGLFQQWGLPVHYFSGFSVAQSIPGADRSMLVDGRSSAFTCGLADLPGGDLFLQLYQGASSPWIDYRSDLWKHLRGPGKLNLGATLFWTVGAEYRESIAAYYGGLMRKGIVRRPPVSEHKRAVALSPQYCAWGAQRERGKTEGKQDEAFLEGVYADLRASGMQAKMFSIDDKWEGVYGKLEHSADRFPHFDDFLRRLKADGYLLGMWAALMRCEHPEDMGLTADNMLKGPDGKPYLTSNFGRASYYILDFTQPVVEQALTELVRKFMRRYKPDMLKFDFGYELPSVMTAAPKDKRYSGERLLLKGIEIVVKAMRLENPDIVVMYYNLSPLFIEYFDICGLDDLFMVQGEYDVEANRRIYFSSLLGGLGVSTYGSSGYDWASSPSIWFDSAASGSIGSLNDFVLDEEGEGATPELIARYNGVAQVLRPTSTFEVVALGEVSQGATRGAHARSWARLEGGQLVLMAYRPDPAGEPNVLASRSKDKRIQDAVSALAPVIVSSKTPEDIAHSRQLAVVAYGDGPVVVRRDAGSRAEVVSHYLGGGAAKKMYSIRDGKLTLTAAQRDASGRPLQWMDVVIG